MGEGEIYGIWFMGTASFSAVVLGVTAKMCFHTRYWNKYFRYIAYFFLAFFFLTAYLLCEPISSPFYVGAIFTQPEVVGIMPRLFTTLQYYLSQILAIGLIVLPDF